MANGLYDGVSGLALGTGLYRNVSGLWGGASGFINGFGGASLDLNFLTMTAATFDSRITFSRGSNATLVDSTGKVTYAPANLLLNSENFAAASWTTLRGTIATDVIASPDGSLTADKFTEDATTNTHSTSVTSNITNGASYTFSAYLKNGDRRFVSLIVVNNSTGANGFLATFDLQNGTYTTQNRGASVIAAASMTPLSDGWYRCSVSGVSTENLTQTFISPATTATPTQGVYGRESYTGDGAKFFYLWGAQLEPITYQTTPGTYVATTSAAYYGPRFDYDPVTLAAKGLLIEEQRTNSLTYSEQFNNAAWAKLSSGTATADTATSPDGTTNADTLTAASGSSGIYQNPVGANSTTYTASIYFKAGTLTNVRYGLTNQNESSQSYYTFTLSGTGSAVVNSLSGFTSASATITDAGNGWYRCTVTATSPSTGTTNVGAMIRFSAAGTVFAWGAQLEAGSFATSYIPTVASTVTRSADVATMTGTNFSNWYNQSAGTFVMGADSPASGTRCVVAADDNSANNSIRLHSVGTDPKMLVDASGVTQADIDAGTITANTAFKLAGAYQLNDFAASAGGDAAVTDTSGTVPTVDRLRIGAAQPGNYLNGHVRTLTYYQTRLPNATLQALTV